MECDVNIPAGRVPRRRCCRGRRKRQGAQTELFGERLKGTFDLTKMFFQTSQALVLTACPGQHILLYAILFAGRQICPPQLKDAEMVPQGCVFFHNGKNIGQQRGL